MKINLEMLKGDNAEIKLETLVGDFIGDIDVARDLFMTLNPTYKY